MSLDFHCDLDENWLMCKIHRSDRNVNKVEEPWDNCHPINAIKVSKN